MRVAWFDAFSGVSGDMTVGALLDLGVPLAVIEAGLAPLGVGGFSLRHDHLVRSGIQASKFRVLVDGDDGGIARVPSHRHDDAAHDHGHDHDHDHAQGHGHAHPHRHYRDIRELLDRAPLAPGVRDRAQRIFKSLALAEAKVHATSPEEVAFHEVGAVDAIVDVVSTAIGLEFLGIERIHVSPLPLGRGFARSEHGVIPVPPPATAELLRGFPVLPWDGDRELVTPTGAAILAALARPGDPGPFVPIAVGYGAGDRELADRPNLLRVVVGEPVGSGAESDGHGHAHAPRPAAGRAPSGMVADEMLVLEADVDDMNPQFWDAAREALFAAGARDVTLTATAMKKGRPGTLLRVVAEPALRDRLAAVVLRETSTIGVRTHAVSRLTLPRRIEHVATPWGEVATKVVTQPDGSLRATPEYEDCLRLAREHGVPVARVHEAALVAASRGREA
ncbi:MAG: nickel pincer cofactor biosynthesis protein LarC [Alphaproteobacteria bacterium]